MANEQTSTILNLFQDIYWELNSVVKVLIKTLFLLWDAWIDVNLKKKWTMILISSIKMRINTKQFCQIMIKNIESATKQWGYKKRNSIIEMLEATIKDGD
ncbi:MAG: hypothetical protein EHM28_01275 [Spirochaetaceae bacterium]|nr:MAG: hypothetical protein EHM28_01275 [Spirochaetaceae bacterium]